MDLLSIVFLSVGLAMDCFAVSLSKGLALSVVAGRHPRHWLMAVLFGLFQGGMPLVGYYAGTLFATFFERYAPWIALVLLTLIGGKMIVESLRPEKEDEQSSITDMSLLTLVLLAVATSIDALASGVIFIPCPEWLWCGIAVIAVGSLLFSLAGWWVGRLFGKRFKLNMGLIGGLILVGIGIKIWVEGLWF